VSPAPVLIVDTAVANTASLAAALARAGAASEVTSDPERVRTASRVVLPGVGSFGAAARRLSDTGLDSALVERVRCDRPLLAICLGQQLLGTASLESPRARGLGIVDLVARPIGDGSVPVPQQGWNAVTAETSCRVLGSGWAAFANGYAFMERPTGFDVAWCDYGGRFVAGLERGSLVACQFHPELSSDFGAALLERFLVGAPRSVATAGGAR
jgi:imidazole glycerol phosphate synthase glutamine amidotransferase subunit